MIERIIDAAFDGWCEGECVSNPQELSNIQHMINSLTQQLQIEGSNKAQVENAVSELICLCEKNAFFEGFWICMKLFVGQLS